MKKWHALCAVVAVAVGVVAAVPASAQTTINEKAVISHGALLGMTTIDPQKSNSVANFTYLELMYDRLLDQEGGTLTLKPMLATSWSTAADGLSVTLQLRHGVKFVDGTDFTSASVKATMNRGKTLPGSTVKVMLDAVKKVVPLGPYAVRLELSRRDSTLLISLADHAGLMISDKAIAENRDLSRGDPKAGTAPFMPTVLNIPKSMRFVKRPNFKYWDAANSLRFNELRLYNTASVPAMISGLKSGLFDLVKLPISVSSAKQQLGPNFEVGLLPTKNIREFFINENGALKEPATRKAIIQAIDWKSIAEKILDDRHKYSSQVAVPSDPAFIPGYTPFPYTPNDPTVKAKLNGLQFTVVLPNILPDDAKIWAVANDILSNYGAKPKVTLTDYVTAQNDFAAGKYDMFIGPVGPKPDFAATMNDYFFGAQRVGGPTTSGVVNAAVKSANNYPYGSPQRTAALQRLNRAVSSTYQVIPSATVGTVYAYNKKLHGVDGKMYAVWATNATPRYWYKTK